jgi:hypothetical protein
MPLYSAYFGRFLKSRAISTDDEDKFVPCCSLTSKGPLDLGGLFAAEFGGL